MTKPSLRLERQLLRAGAGRVAGMDEVGRGAIAGPVSVGVAVVDLSTGTAPFGLRDSKLLSPHARQTLRPKIRAWCVESAVGHATSAEIDEFGLVASLSLAAWRALNQIQDVDHVILDGNHNWLSASDSSVRRADRADRQDRAPAVTTVVGGDLKCSSVAAASVVAKVVRDEIMIEVADTFPEFGWDRNKGYATKQHNDAIRSHGLCSEHRQSWQLDAAGIDHGPSNRDQQQRRHFRSDS